MVEKRPFTEVVFKEGTISNLYGLPGAGKTNVASFFMEKGVERGFYIYTNVHFFKLEDVGKAIKMGKLPPGPHYIRKPEQIMTVTKISDLLEGLLTTRKNITFIDEGGFFATSTLGTSKKVRQLKELCYIIRHLNSSFFLIAQARGSIVPDLRKTLIQYQLDIYKKSDKYRELSISIAETYINEDGERDVRFKEIDTIGAIPLSRLPWDGYFLPKFKFDIDLTEAFDELGEYNSVDVIEHGPAIIRKLKKEAKSKKEEDDGGREKTSDFHERVRQEWSTLEDTGMFKSRSDLCGHLAKEFKKSSQTIYYITSSLPFDKEKFDPSKKKP